MKMSQAYPSFSGSRFTTHFTPGGCIIVICFDEWEHYRGICIKDDADEDADTSIR
jgi:hypothetical protein